MLTKNIVPDWGWGWWHSLIILGWRTRWFRIYKPSFLYIIILFQHSESNFSVFTIFPTTGTLLFYGTLQLTALGTPFFVSILIQDSRFISPALVLALHIFPSTSTRAALDPPLRHQLWHPIQQAWTKQGIPPNYWPVNQQSSRADRKHCLNTSPSSYYLSFWFLKINYLKIMSDFYKEYLIVCQQFKLQLVSIHSTAKLHHHC